MTSELEQAVAHQKAGRLTEAEEIYHRLLATEPGHPEALHWLGVLRLQQDDPATAIDLIGRALKAKPDYLQGQCNLALALQAQGRLQEAVTAYERALALSPDDVEIQINLALALQAQGRLTEAVEILRRALSFEPHFEAHKVLADLLLQQGSSSAAADEYRRALALQPDSAMVYYSLGRALQIQGDPSGAIGAYRRALALDPGLVPAYTNLGAALYAQHEPAEAEKAFREYLNLNATDADVWNNLGLALAAQGKNEEARVTFRRALQLDPSLSAAHNNLGNVYAAEGDFSAAIPAYERAVALEPDYADAYSNLGNVLAERGRLSDAIAAYDQSIALAPSVARVNSNRGAALLRQGQHEVAIAAYRQAFALDPEYAEGHSNLLQAMHYDPELHPETIFAEARRWHRVHAVALAARPCTYENSRDPARRVRLGYVSADFRCHPVGWFLAPVFAHHDRKRFEVFCYSGVTHPDDFTEVFRSQADCWRETPGDNDEQLAERIRADVIDILIDLSGHTRGHRLLTFARKPAPIQVTAGGHYGTTGLDAIDYLIADRFHAPAGTGRHFSETLIRMPHDYICYKPPAYAPDASTPPSMQRGYVTFGCYNNLAKLNDKVIALWAKILEHLPTARLRLQTRELNDVPTGERIQAIFAERGVVRERLQLEGGVPHHELLAAYAEIDIALDPFPYSGGLTTLEALWMGVPVVTLTGQTFCGRHSTSHLNNVGLSELVTDDPETYVATAVGLAQDCKRLTALREGLRDQMATSSLCDVERYTRDLEAAYQEMWQKYCSQ
jgi:protein O-GlcNAc transferase